MRKRRERRRGEEDGNKKRGESWPAVNVRRVRQSELGSVCAHQDHGDHHLILLSPLGSLALLNGAV